MLMLLQILFSLLLILIPIGDVVWFIVTLVLYIRSTKNGAQGKTVYLVQTIIAGVLFLVMLASVVFLSALFMLAISHM